MESSIGSIYGIPFHVPKSELKTQLLLSERLGLNWMSPESFGYATIIDGNLEGWVALPQGSTHPIPYRYLLTSSYVAKRKWATSIWKWPTSKIFTKLVFIGLRMQTADSYVTLDCSCPIADVGVAKIGGIKYPSMLFSNIPTTGIGEVRGAQLRSTTISGSERISCLSLALPILGGLASSDAVKFVNYPGPSLCIWHDAAPMFPIDLVFGSTVPATFVVPSWEVGTYGNTPSDWTWTASETIAALTYQFTALGTLTPSQIQARLYGNKPNIDLYVTDGMYDDPNFLASGDMRTLDTTFYAFSSVRRFTSKL